MTDFMERASNVVSDIGVLAGRSLEHMRKFTATRRAERAAAAKRLEQEREEERLVITAAETALKARLPAACDGYRPVLTQHDVDQVNSYYHGQIAALLEDELGRIRVAVLALLDEVGLPSTIKNEGNRTQVRAVADLAWSAFETKAFAHLRLPPNFILRGGQIRYEGADWVDGLYRGRLTGTLYSAPPRLRAAG